MILIDQRERNPALGNTKEREHQSPIDDPMSNQLKGSKLFATSGGDF